MSYFKRILTALDQLVNAIFNGWPDETISSRSYRWDKDNIRHWPRKLIDRIALIFNDKNHCYKSYISERIGRQLPPELRHE